MTIDLFDIFYNLLMELIDFAIIYGIFFIIIYILTRSLKKTGIYITTAIFSIYAVISSYSTFVLIGEIQFFELIINMIVFPIVSVVTCVLSIVKINKKLKYTPVTDADTNTQQVKPEGITKGNTTTLTVGTDISSGKHIVVPIDSNGGIIYIYQDDQLSKRKLIDKGKVVNFKQNTKVTLYNCVIK